MKFALLGVETNNKGAELMLYAILQEIERKFPDSTVYVEPRSIPQGLQYIHTSLYLKERPVFAFEQLCIRLHLCRLMKWVFGQDVFADKYAVNGVDFLFDDSGFFYSDKWNLPIEMVDTRGELLSAMHRNGTKICFLPQAFGPLTQPAILKGLSDLQKYATVVMPREKTSLKYVVETHIVDEDRLKLFPDFTSLVDGIIPDGFQHLAGGICIIPNIRMLDMTDTTYEDYLTFISMLVHVSLQEGHRPYLLNHEGRSDAQLALRIQHDLDVDVEVVDGMNGLEIKGLISQSYLVVSSRFHGVVSALNSCVPCLATSWGHKYEELFVDYQQTDCVLSIHALSASAQRFRSVLKPELNASIRAELQPLVESKRQLARDMWKYVWSLSEK